MSGADQNKKSPIAGNRWTEKTAIRSILVLGMLWQFHSHALAPMAATPNGEKYALIIGNANYIQRPLVNPTNDARVMADLLRQAGFEVHLLLDARTTQMRDAVAQFQKRTSSSDIAKTVLFYYAGHGMQLQWRNFLIGVDAKISRPEDVPVHSLDVAEILGEPNAAGKTGRRQLVLILDACRDNPFRVALSLEQKGLSQFDAPPNTLVAFSTAPGQLAMDGEGSNSIYTGMLAKELSVPGVSLEDALKRVRMGVRVASLGRQLPWESTSLEEHLFIQPLNKVTSNAVDLEELEKQINHEVTAWNLVKKIGDIPALVNFLQQFPSGNFNQLAQHRLEKLLTERAKQEAAILAASQEAALERERLASARAEAERQRKAQEEALAQRLAEQKAVDERGEQQRVGPPPVTTSGQPSLALASQQAAHAAASGTTMSGMNLTSAASVPLSSYPLIMSFMQAAEKIHLAPALPAAQALATLVTPEVTAVNPAPNFKGAAPLNREYIVGDRYEYNVTDVLRNTTQTQVNSVTKVSDSEGVQYNNGEFTSDLMGNATNTNLGPLGSPRQFYPSNLQVGNNWITSFSQPRSTGRTQYFRYDVRITDREIIRVPAGTFNAFRIEALGYNLTQGHRIERTLWVAPGINANIASDVKIRTPSGILEQHERRELRNYRSGHRPNVLTASI